jgi:hypothetical protein
MTGLVRKGALVEFMPTFLPVAVPNVIVFQYNPATMTHTWTQPEAAGEPGVETSNPMAVQGMPGEEFSFTIELDAQEDIAGGPGPASALAGRAGLYSRLAALEMLLYPAETTSGLVGTVSAAIESALSGDDDGPVRAVPESVMPVTLFIWGAGRIVPVRVTQLTVTETLYDAALNPVQAQAQVSLRVLTPAELTAASADDDALASLATVAYTYTLALRQALAAANLATATESIIGMIPR